MLLPKPVISYLPCVRNYNFDSMSFKRNIRKKNRSEAHFLQNPI